LLSPVLENWRPSLETYTKILKCVVGVIVFVKQFYVKYLKRDCCGECSLAVKQELGIKHQEFLFTELFLLYFVIFVTCCFCQ
jgi:hypothetical protein